MRLPSPKTFLLGLLFLLGGPTYAHNIHATLTELEWNETDRSLEVIVQIHAHQLEARLSVDKGDRLTILSDADLPRIEEAAGTLIQSRLSVHADGNNLTLSYIGMDIADQVIRLYLETDLAEAPTSLKVRNELFLDVLPAQVNDVIAKVGRHRTAGKITSTNREVELTFP